MEKNKQEFILASGSPRRLELLQQIGIKPRVMVSDFAEIMENLPPKQLVLENALGKGRSVAKEANQAAVVIAADTIVVANNKILGKPHSVEEAEAMLTKLSGTRHNVMTGVAIFYRGNCKSFVEVTEVEFYELTKGSIRDYVATGEPLDKAGAYGIQGRGAVLVKGIHGSYSNVVGLPLGSLFQTLKQMGL